MVGRSVAAGADGDAGALVDEGEAVEATDGDVLASVAAARTMKVNRPLIG